MEKVSAFLDKVPGWLQPIAFGVSIIMFIVAGIMMTTGQEGSAKAKKMMAYIAIGLAIAFMATSIATSIRGAAM